MHVRDVARAAGRVVVAPALHVERLRGALRDVHRIVVLGADDGARDQYPRVAWRWRGFD